MMDRAERLLLASVGVGALHHLDHILRFDHSGWPFRDEVTLFTYSLVVYPIAASIFAFRSGHWWRVTSAAFLFLAPTLAHVTVETPLDQYQTWAQRPQVNLPGVESSALGIAAAVVTIALSALAFYAFLAFWREGRAGARSGLE